MTLTCVFEADPAPFEYICQFTDSTGTTMELTDGDKYVIQSSSGDNSLTSTLTITATMYADRGTYNCIVYLHRSAIECCVSPESSRTLPTNVYTDWYNIELRCNKACTSKNFLTYSFY